ncbi:low specificity L-threonine aldolase [Quadrisphaera setariae]|uniref:Low specificity L-threonine aldolase n=2 Tax=Quadrisphaera setariae TaxID=2593304 RepID=A0A5C8ZF12_9ACTN|nr:GntG family PLP-dependent aldolase [Quadrisphaera setariae]TXR55751.1 low specificity L-threonine aldolase [Quadrisphaera setariae]
MAASTADAAGASGYGASAPRSGPPVRVDLRSDTLTRPTPAMRRAVAEADVGDDVYAEDPTTTALEARVAELLGHEAGLFTPSGSLANVLGVRLLVEPGQELLCDARAHVVRAELGAHAVTSGVTTRTWDASRGLLDDDAVGRVAAMMTPDAGPHLVSTAAVAVEDTHNFGGGTVQPLAALHRLHEVTSSAGVALHLDGARLWNAAVVQGAAHPDGWQGVVREVGGVVATASVCLSKGLGAPVGSVLVSSAENIARARTWRKRMGAGMRQTGLLAAAGLHALDHHVERLADDHARARRLALAVAEARPGCTDPDAVETNIVVLDVEDARALVLAAAERGVALSALGPRTARLVTHLDVDDEGADLAAAVLSELLSR